MKDLPCVRREHNRLSATASRAITGGDAKMGSHSLNGQPFFFRVS